MPQQRRGTRQRSWIVVAASSVLLGQLILCLKATDAFVHLTNGLRPYGPGSAQTCRRASSVVMLAGKQPTSRGATNGTEVISRPRALAKQGESKAAELRRARQMVGKVRAPAVRPQPPVRPPPEIPQPPKKEPIPQQVTMADLKTANEVVGRAKALAAPGTSKAEELRRAKQEKEKASKPRFINPIDIPIQAGRAARRALERLGQGPEDLKPAATTEQAPKDAYRIYFDQKFFYAVPKPDENTPTVLVVGATGETGSQVVRKLALKGYRVRVLVRKLYSKTLSLLGNGVTYVRGDLTDMNSLRAATTGVDKVIFCAQARTEDELDARTVDSQGLRNVVQAYQDTRTSGDGDKLAIKRTLIKFRKTADQNAFKAVSVSGVEGVEWKALPEDIKANRPTFSGSFAAGGGKAMLESAKTQLDLSSFGGMLMLYRAKAGASYKLIIRTRKGSEAGVDYELPLPDTNDRFTSYRMNFRDFQPCMVIDGSPYIGFDPSIRKLDPSDVVQLAVVATGAGTGFQLTMEGIKMFRASTQPDFLVISSSDIKAEKELLPLDENAGVAERRRYYRSQGEASLINSGLSYTIVRVSGYTTAPGERPLSISKDGNNMGLISRADAAEVAVSCLFNDKVVNTELFASQNPRFGDRDIPRLINDLFEEAPSLGI